MKKLLTENIGLKILSVFASVILWLMVVNVDDPMITRTYSGIPVEIVNTEYVTDDGKTYKVLEGTDTVTVVIQANRSIIEAMSRDYIRAIADMKDITIMNTVAIEVRSTRYADRIDSITSRTKNLKLEIEERTEKDAEIRVEMTGKPEDGYAVGSVKPSSHTVSVSGPESVVSRVAYARALIDVDDLKTDVATDVAITLYDDNDSVIDTSNLTLSVEEINCEINLFDVKEVPISFTISGTPAQGRVASANVGYSPETISIVGEGDVFDELSVIQVDDALSIEGADDDVTISLDIRDYLPEGVVLADSSFDGIVNVTAYVDAYSTNDITVPFTNISIINIPEGYAANILSESDSVTFSVVGTSDDIKSLDGGAITGTIDATTLVPRLLDGENLTEGNIHAGINTGQIVFNLPSGITESAPVYATVNLAIFDSSILTQIPVVPEGEIAGELPAAELPLGEIPVTDEDAVLQQN